MTNFSTASVTQKGQDQKTGIHLTVGKDGIIKFHDYYQWIYVFLLVEAFCFYMTHLMWKNYENKTLELFLDNCDLSKCANSSSLSIGLATTHSSPNNSMSDSPDRKTDVIIDDSRISTAMSVDRQQFLFKKGCIFIDKKLKHIANRRLFVFRLCLFVNLLNVAFVFFLNCRFVGLETFSLLGFDFLKNCAFDHFTKECALFRSYTFPFLTKCTFFTFGPSGTFQNNDSLCLLAANGVNFFVFTVIWFWFVFMTIFSVFHKICFDILYCQPFWYFRFMNLKKKAYLTPSDSLKSFVKQTPIGIHFFLEQVSSNANPILFAEFIDFMIMDFKQ